jgi:hypothetical protein
MPRSKEAADGDDEDNDYSTIVKSFNHFERLQSQHSAYILIAAGVHRI